MESAFFMSWKPELHDAEPSGRFPVYLLGRGVELYEDDPLQFRICRDSRLGRRQGNHSSFAHGIAIDTGADGRKGDAFQAVLMRHLETAAVGRFKQTRLTRAARLSRPARPYGSRAGRADGTLS